MLKPNLLYRDEQKPQRSLLLVDDEENITRSLIRLLRQDNYKIYTAKSGEEGLEILKQHQIGVILSDQRMPEMSGTEFLSKVRKNYPDTIRIVLSGYTDLRSVTDAINEGEIYKFLTKPWDDNLLRGNISEAFKQYELELENERLRGELTNANEELKKVNLNLENNIEGQARSAQLNMLRLKFSQDILQMIPVGVLGVDSNNEIVLANEMAHRILAEYAANLIGENVENVIPGNIVELINSDNVNKFYKAVKLKGNNIFNISIKKREYSATTFGLILSFIPVLED